MASPSRGAERPIDSFLAGASLFIIPYTDERNNSSREKIRREGGTSYRVSEESSNTCALLRSTGSKTSASWTSVSRVSCFSLLVLTVARVPPAARTAYF